MLSKRRKWTYESIHTEALKYTTRNAFQDGSESAYRAAGRNNILNEVCAHMIAKRTDWTLKTVAAAASEYTTRTAFKWGNNKAYQWATKNKVVDEVCSHMILSDKATKYNEPMYMYFIKITTLNESLPTVWKIGITKHKDILVRFRHEFTPFATKIEVIQTWYYATGHLAVTAEKNVVDHYSMYKYQGCSPLFKTKTSEMFTEDILQISEGE